MDWLAGGIFLFLAAFGFFAGLAFTVQRRPTSAFLSLTAAVLAGASLLSLIT